MWGSANFQQDKNNHHRIDGWLMCNFCISTSFLFLSFCSVLHIKLLYDFGRFRKLCVRQMDYVNTFTELFGAWQPMVICYFCFMGKKSICIPQKEHIWNDIKVNKSQQHFHWTAPLRVGDGNRGLPDRLIRRFVRPLEGGISNICHTFAVCMCEIRPLF